MAVREDTARDVRHEPAPHGRHGRPRPFGGWFRLPTVRFSGAAMAMSTVVGISIATTLLLNEQQGIGRQDGVARVGTTPPPTPGAGDQAEAASAQTPAGGASPSGHPHPAAGHSSTSPSAHPSVAATVAATPPAPRTAAPAAPLTGGQASAGQDAPPSGTLLAGTESDGRAPSGPSPSPSGPAPTGPSFATPTPHPPGARPARPGHPAPPPSAPAPDSADSAGASDPDSLPGPSGSYSWTGPEDSPTGPTDPSAAPDSDRTLSGTAAASPLGRAGLRHRLTLDVTERVTAFQAEFRLAPAELAPGTGTVWTDLPGVVVTVQQERGTLVYRFTTPPGADVRPGHYTFAVRGARPAAEPSPGVRKGAPAESWSVSAFALDHPRAVAALGAFGHAPASPAATAAPSATAAAR
ncbi:hypothetical protein ACFRAR_03935 [Kitasatospora sp. NPDC056651]|uniref:hypothetical protein n=1 Tax=Kitasatospora sp. NPDC056651 TaxID=3345892 RepID=UPI0036B0550D